jgi:anti-anti-sigma regulatory factor
VTAAAAGLRIAYRAVGYRRVIQLDGHLESATVGMLGHAFWDAVECGARQIWLDLSGVADIDEAGVQAVCALGPAAHELERSVLLVCARGPVRSALAEHALDEKLPMFPTLSAAHYEHPPPEA